MDEAIKAAIEDKLGTKVINSWPLSGGMVNTAARVETTNGPIFVKWKDNTPARFFEMEVEGLQLLANSHALRVPKALAYQDKQTGDDNTPAFLALDWIDERTPSSAEQFKHHFAEGLAALHRNTSPTGQFGLEYDNFLGSQPQKNTPNANWAEFYRDCRIAVQVQKCREHSLLSPARERALSNLMEKMPEILSGVEDKPALIHGDLWSGNYLTAGDEAVLIDPAVYYADREVEMAYVELFGGFPYGFLAAYNNAYPLPAGYDYRRPMHQLYYLLVHLVHFGEEYGPAVDGVCQFYLN